MLKEEIFLLYILKKTVIELTQAGYREETTINLFFSSLD